MKAVHQMRFIFATLLAAAALAGCAAHVASSSDRTVVVNARVQDIDSAQKLADAECKKVGRFARLSGKASLNQFVYDCVN